jgi:hypothetical protein
MSRLDAKWSNFGLRGQAWDSWWQDGPAEAADITALPTAASLTLTGATPSVFVTDPKTVTPTAASLVLTGSAPELALSVFPTAAALAFAFGTPTVLAPRAVAPTAASLVAAGATPTVAATDNRYITPGPLGLVLTGAVPDIGGIATGSRGGRIGAPVRFPDIPAPDPDADEAFLLVI